MPAVLPSSPTPSRFLLAVLLTVLLGACQSAPDRCADEDPAIAALDVGPVAVTRYEAAFLPVRTPAQATAFAARYPTFARQYLLRGQYPSDTVFAGQLTKLTTNPGFQKLAQEATTAFGEFAPQQAQLRGAFQHIRHYYPTFRPPQVGTFVSGLSQDIFLSDSLLVLGLDFFIGPKASYLPNTTAYIQRRYQPPYLVPSAVLLLADGFVRSNPQDRTLLSQMVQFGKAYYFAERMLPCVPDSLLIGFTGRELVGAQFNEQRIWSHFLEKQLLYTTEASVAQKYLGERPVVPEIGKECPGRIGRWVGWQIVRAYAAENPNTPLPQLLAEPDAQKILAGAHYKPRKQ